MTQKGRRRLAAIMFTDIVGYSRFMQEDERYGLQLRQRHKDVFEFATQKFGGQVIQYFGDGTLSIFESAVAAVECAVDMQKEFQKEPKVPLRIGIHLGDIHFDETEVFGHGVNVAARIEPVCKPGGIFISDKVFDEVKNQSNLNAKPLGIFQFKNINRDVGLYAIQEKGIATPNANEIAFLKELTQKVNLASVAEKSEAFKRFQSETRRKKRKQWVLWGALSAFVISIFLIIGHFTGILLPHEPAGLDESVSIAVLPFANMSAKEDNEYFSDGMTEDILTLISKIEGFSVTSRTSVMQYKNTRKTARQIARELGVNHILEGSVRRDGNRVRINAQLIDAIEDEHIWAKTYDEEMTSIFEVQSAVASDIAHHLKKNLSSSQLELIELKPTKNVTAYEDYLKGREYYRKYTPEDNEKAIQYFKKSLDADPNYAYAYAGLGDAYSQKSYHNKLKQDLLDSAIMASKKAIELNPQLSDGYKSLGLALQYKGEPEKAKEQYQKAINLDPYNDMASNNLGMIERDEGNIVEAAKWAKHTYSVNKNIPASAVNLARIYYDLGDDHTTKKIIDDGLALNPEVPELKELKTSLLLREKNFEEAKKEAEDLIKIDPESSAGYHLLGEVFMHEGNWDEANKELNKAKKYCTDKYPYKKTMIESMVAFTEHKKGNTEKAKQSWTGILDVLENTGEEGMKGMEKDIFKSGIFAAMGDEQEALKFIKVLNNKNWLDHKSWSSHPVFDDLKKNPEFQEILKEAQSKTDSLLIKLKEPTP